MAFTSTNHLHDVVATPGGVWRHHRDRRVPWPLALVIVGGAIPGVWLGAWLRVRHLPDPARFRLFQPGTENGVQADRRRALEGWSGRPFTSAARRA
jgi:hypothetical protein